MHFWWGDRKPNALRSQEIAISESGIALNVHVSVDTFADGSGIKLRAYLRAAIDGNRAALAVIKHQLAKFPGRATTRSSSVLAV